MTFFSSYVAFTPVSLSISLVAVVLCFVIHYLIYSKRIAQWTSSNIPFLKPTFLIGHKYFLNLAKNSYLVSVDRIYKENPDKDAVGFFLGTTPLILLRNPRLIQQVFAKNFEKAFETGLYGGAQDEEVSQNIIQVATDKDAWKRGRKTMAPIFSPSRMGGEQFDKIRKQVDNMLAHTQEIQLSGKPVNTYEMTHNVVTDATSLWFFGQDSNSFKEKGELYQMVTSFLEPGVMRMLSVYIRTQFTRIRWLPESLKFVGKKHIDAMTRFLRRQIHQKDQQKTNGNDFLDFLMTLRDGKMSDAENNAGLSMKQMVGLSFSVTTFGLRDVRRLSSFAIHLLSLHPEYQDKIREEVLEAMRKHQTSELTFQVIQDLPFTQQCILETLRLYPGSPTIMRICKEDFHVPGTDYTFRKGDKLIIDPYSVQRDPKYYENPNAFNPERFSPENKIAPEFFLSFGHGPRKCPGSKIGVLMAATIVAPLVLKYDIKPRSHVKQMDVTDFHPRCFFNLHKENVFVDLTPTMVH